MRKFLTYSGVFVVSAVLMQLLLFDSIHLWIYFAPLAYVAFIVLLPLNTKPIVMLALGLFTGVFMDFFEGTGGLHTVVTLFTAFTRRYDIALVLGRDVLEEDWMPSPGTLGTGKFIRYGALVVGVHCLLYFCLEALTWANLPFVILKIIVSGVVTLLAVWAVAILFTPGGEAARALRVVRKKARKI